MMYRPIKEKPGRMGRIRREILTALSTATEPMANAELRAVCPSALSSDQMSGALNQLKYAGHIEESGLRKPTEITRGAKPVMTYRIVTQQEQPAPATDVEKLMKHLESELKDDSKIKEKMLSADAEDDAEACLDSSTGSQAGDEFQKCNCQCIERINEISESLDGLLMTIADDLLADHPTWKRVRSMQSDVLDAWFCAKRCAA